MVRFKKGRKKKGVSIRKSVTKNTRCLLEDSEQTSFSGMGNVNTEKRGERYVSGCFQVTREECWSVFSCAFSFLLHSLRLHI